jgi:hypothetical protein
MPDHIREWLEKASAASGKSIAEEIRDRVSQTFRILTDDKTRNLIDFAVQLAQKLEFDTGRQWHEHRSVGEVFNTALAARIRRLQTRDGESGSEPGAFQIRHEPFSDKVVTRQADRIEYARVLEWFDDQTRHLVGTAIRNAKEGGGDVDP